MTVQFVDIPFGLERVSRREKIVYTSVTYRNSLYFGDLRHIVLIVDTVAQDIAEVPQSPL